MPSSTKGSRKSEPPRLPGLVFRQPLGSGGYADVYLYEQQSPRMPVAVKVLKGEGLTLALKRQFAEEADTMAELGDHPYIVQVFRSGTSDDGRPYLVMKYYPGLNLAARARTERFSVEEVLRTGIQLASAVEVAHRGGIIHRDIKPANVLVSTYGAPGLTDFGIAGRGGAAGATEAETLESTDDIGVSVPWAPPEVLYGQSNGSVRADVYSLAATLWQLLVGRSPFEVPGGDNSAFALMPRIRSTAVAATGRQDVPPALERLLAQAMSKDPALRPASALEFARALQGIEQEQRMNLTPIVVLDAHGQTMLESPGTGAGSTPNDDDEDRTRVKAPQTVRAQGPAPVTSLPDAVEPRPAPVPSQPSGLVTPAPVRASATTDPTTSATAPYGPADEHTVRRGAATGENDSAPTVSGPARSRTSPVVVGLAAAVAVLLGVVIWFLVGRGDTPAASPSPSPSPTVNVPVDNDPVVGAVFERPTVVAEPKPGAVEFRWTYPGPVTADTYRVFVGPDAARAAEAAPLTVPDPATSVTAAPGTTVCALVEVDRSGVTSPRSAPICETSL